MLLAALITASNLNNAGVVAWEWTLDTNVNTTVAAWNTTSRFGSTFQCTPPAGGYGDVILTLKVTGAPFDDGRPNVSIDRVVLGVRGPSTAVYPLGVPVPHPKESSAGSSTPTLIDKALGREGRVAEALVAVANFVAIPPAAGVSSAQGAIGVVTYSNGGGVVATQTSTSNVELKTAYSGQVRGSVSFCGASNTWQQKAPDPYGYKFFQTGGTGADPKWQYPGMLVDRHLEDYLARDGSGNITDLKPGYSGGPVTDPGDPANLTGNDNIDWSPAFTRLMTELYDLTPTAGVGGFAWYKTVRLRFDTRAVWYFYSRLDIRHPIEMVGICNPFTNAGTRLIFKGCAGMYVFWDPPPPPPPGAITGHSGRLTLRGLNLEYNARSGVTPQDTWHGIDCRWPCLIEDFAIRSFPGRGLSMYVTADPQDDPNFGNVALSWVRNGIIYGCGRSGMYLGGHDAGVVSVEHVNSSRNGLSQIADDHYGFYDNNQVGATYMFCHTRNNHIAGYRADFYGGLSPSASLYLNCYSERAAVADPVNQVEGPPLIDSGAMVIGTILGSLEKGSSSVAGRATGASIYSSNGRINIWPSLFLGDVENATMTLGYTTPPVSTVRQYGLFRSEYYGTGANASEWRLIHDVASTTKAFGFSHLAASGPMPLGITDHTHARPRVALAANGLLIGSSSPRFLGYHDPANETTGTSLHTRFPLSSCQPGDRVFSMKPTATTYPWQGWHVVLQVDGTTKEWRRFGESDIGGTLILPLGTFYQ